MGRISQRRLFRFSKNSIIAFGLVSAAVATGPSVDGTGQKERVLGLSGQPEPKTYAQTVSANLPKAVCGENDRMFIETDCLTAEIWPNGYVSGVKANTLVDRKTGARDSSFGLDIVDLLRERVKLPPPEAHSFEI